MRAIVRESDEINNGRDKVTATELPNSFSRHPRPSTDSADPLVVGRPRRGSLNGDGSVGGLCRGDYDEEERAKIQTGANVQVFITGGDDGDGIWFGFVARRVADTCNQEDARSRKMG